MYSIAPLSLQAHRVEAGAHLSTAETGLRPRYNPIDHIFQFHKALRRDLIALEQSAQSFNAAVQESDTAEGFAPVSALNPGQCRP